ncbi:MAG: hypothetical protein P8N09_01485 [Planctomycetota bacterium]|nr:hypothetical protein [Planctomycetota bacterium]
MSYLFLGRLLVVGALSMLFGFGCAGVGGTESSGRDAEGGEVAPSPDSQVTISALPQELNSVVVLEAFGPVEGTSQEQFDEWTELVNARFLGNPSPEQLVELDDQLAKLPVVDGTPVFINALSGLDMADPDDIVRAAALSKWWYDAQVHYKRVILNPDPEALRLVDVRNRLLVVDGWRRMWVRILEQANGVAIFRARVKQLLVDRVAAREKQWREFEEKLKRRAEQEAEAEAEAAADGKPYWKRNFN